MSSALPSVSDWNARAWQRIADSTAVPAESLGVFRWLFGAYCLLLSAPHASWIDGVPRAFFDPPPLSLAELVSGFPPRPFFLVLDVLALAALACMTIGWRTRTATLALFALKLVAAHFRYSFGKIDHDIMVLAILPCMVLADWGRYHSVDALTRRDEPRGVGRGLSLFGVMLAFGMFTAGLPKALNWVDFDLKTSGVLSWFYPNMVSLGRNELLAPYVGFVPLPMWELADYTAPALELAAGVALLHSRRVWLLWLLVATSFHLVNALLLNIAFNDYVVVYTCFASLTAFGPVLSRWQRPLSLGAAAIVLWHVVARFTGEGSDIAFITDPLVNGKLGLLASIPLCGAAAFLFARELVLGTKRAKSIAPA